MRSHVIGGPACRIRSSAMPGMASRAVLISTTAGAACWKMLITWSLAISRCSVKSVLLGIKSVVQSYIATGSCAIGNMLQDRTGKFGQSHQLQAPCYMVRSCVYLLTAYTGACMPFELFVNGTLMRGLKLHANMGDSQLVGEFRTAPYYRVHTINDIHPGMYRLNDGEAGGASIWGELYMVEDAVWAAIEAGEPPNLYRGTIEL